MTSPKLLFNLILVAIIATVGVIYVALAQHLNLGFTLKEDPKTHTIYIDTVSPSLNAQGVEAGMQLISVQSPMGLVTINPVHFSTTPVQRSEFYATKGEYFTDQDRLYHVLSTPTVTLHFADDVSRTVTFTGKHEFKDFGSVFWVRLSLGLFSAIMGIMVWIWRPFGAGAIYYALSGVGLLLCTIQSAIDSIPMLVHSYGHWLLLDAVILLGTYMYLTFGACALLYFPQHLPFAKRISWPICLSVFVFAFYALFNTWQFGLPASEQVLYFSDAEIYAPILVGFIFVILFCYLQWRASRNKPVERARSSWVALSWLLGPSLYMAFYYVPIISGVEPLMNRTLAWVAICSSYWMILVGLSRFKLFDLEHHIGTVWQWFFVFMVFLGLDMAFASITNFAPQVSTFVVLCLALWVYMPARQWLYNRVNRKNQRQRNRLFSEAISALLANKEQEPQESWRQILVKVFRPASNEWMQGSVVTTVANRGQGLQIAANKFSPAIYLDYADEGARLFTLEDARLIGTMSALFEQLYEFHLAFLAGQNTERERIRRDLHDQVGHKLLSLIYATDDYKVKGLAKSTLEQLRGLITALRFEPVSLQSMIMEIRTVAQDACDYFNLPLHWDNQVAVAEVSIGSYQYLNIVNIARELLNNIVRHAEANEVWISLRLDNDVFFLSFVDDGKGFVRNNVTMNNGLYNIDARARELNATIKWDTENGCRVDLAVPLTKQER